MDFDVTVNNNILTRNREGTEQLRINKKQDGR